VSHIQGSKRPSPVSFALYEEETDESLKSQNVEK